MNRLAVAAFALAACLPPPPPGVPSCEEGRTACGNVCAELPRDDANCGTCGTRCAATDRCVSSACRPRDCAGADCGEQQVCVDGACADESCVGVVCPAGQLCARGACAATDCAGVACPAGRACISGTCRDPACDGVLCPSGATCEAGRCVSSTCTDGLLGVGEADVDCGGSCSLSCGTGRTCGVGADCDTGSCVGGHCAAVCTDGVKNGGETDVDCGGPSCAPCARGLSCVAERDCESMRCFANRCSDCTDGVRNPGEADVDCGGVCAPTRRCADASTCMLDGDCQSGICTAGHCAVAMCTDGLRNGFETDVDCGGSCLPARTCADGRVCLAHADCASHRCDAGACAAPSCMDGVRNGAEVDQDCGAACPTGCATGLSCGSGADCRDHLCGDAGTCLPPSCTDGVANGLESDRDCGSACPVQCGPLALCNAPADCRSAVCTAGRCVGDATCADGVKNRDESDLDCGGTACLPCADERTCLAPRDCAHGFCSSGRCSDGFTLADAGLRYFSYPLTWGAEWMAAGNLDGDPYLDLATVHLGAGTGSNGSTSIFMGTATGALSGPLTILQPTFWGNNARVAMAEVTGDGQMDLVLGSYYDFQDTQNGYMQGNGNGTFQPVIPFRSSPGRHMGWAVADITGDGRPDVATGTETGLVTWARNTGAGFNAQLPTDGGAGGLQADPMNNPCPYTAAGRIDGDGTDDLAVCCRNGLRIVLGGGQPRLLPGITLPLGDPVFSLVVDLDRDGKGDLVVVTATPTDTLYLLKGNGDGTFQSPSPRFVAGVSRVHAADLNADGHPDLLTGGGAGAELWLGQSDGGFLTPLRPWNQAAWRLGYPAIGDFDRDGRLDLAFATANLPGVYLFFQR